MGTTVRHLQIRDVFTKTEITENETPCKSPTTSMVDIWDNFIAKASTSDFTSEPARPLRQFKNLSLPTLSWCTFDREDDRDLGLVAGAWVR